MKYLLDTDILSYLSDSSSIFFPCVAKRMRKLCDDDQVLVSILSFYELENGLFSATSQKLKAQFEVFLRTIREQFVHAPLPLEGSRIFGNLKGQYKTQTGISKSAIKQHDIDFMLASTAIAENMVLVSNDHIFTMMQSLRNDLQVENWATS